MAEILWKFSLFDLVEKTSGYRFPGKVVARFLTSRQQERYVVECNAVTRQAIYNWKSGGSIKEQHLSKLTQLKAAADVLLSENVPGSAYVIGRKLPGGKTILDAIGDGADGYMAAMSLVSMLRDEAAQKSMLDKKLAARLSSAPKNVEYGTPAFDERG